MLVYKVSITSNSYKSLRRFTLVTRQRNIAGRWLYKADVMTTFKLSEACECYDHYQSRGFNVAITESTAAL